MAVQGMGEEPLRGSLDDDRPRRKRPFPSPVEVVEEEASGSLDKDDQESPPARKARGNPSPDPQEEEQEGGRRGAGRGNSPEQKGKEQESCSRGDAPEMHHSSSEGPEDRDRPTGFEEEWILNKGRAVSKSLQGGSGGAQGRPKINMGPGMYAAVPVMWAPSDEVADFWNRSQFILGQNAQDFLLSACPRPALPNKSCDTPKLNPSMKALLNAKQMKAYWSASSFLSLIHEEVLNMLAPAMTIYEMAEESIRKQEPVDPQELREWARHVIRYIGSLNQRLHLQHCSCVLEAINPQLKSMMNKICGPSANGLLFAEDDVKRLKEIIQSFPEVKKEPIVPTPRDGSQKGASGNSGNCPQDGAGELLSACQSSTAEVPSEKAASLQLWHRRFAHQDPKLILEMQNHNLAVGLKVSESDAGSPAICAICLKIKGAGTPSPPRTERRSTEVLDLIHVGLHRPFHVSSRVNKIHFLSFVDDFSRYCVTCQLTEERAAEETIRIYMAALRKTFRRKPKAFQLGDGTEGLSDDSRACLENEDIVLRRSDAQSSKSSGSAKWEITSLLEMTRCMLADAQLPDKFWGDALRTATYLLNRLPADCTGKTPFELWYGRVPSLDHIRVFGSQAYDHLPLPERKDTGTTTEQTILLGYIPSGKLYRVVNIETGEIHRKQVIYFVEDEKVDQSKVVLNASENCEVGPSFTTELRSNSMQEEDDGTLSHQSSTAEAPSEKEASLQLWHRRFAHRDPKLILEMQNHNLAVGLQVSESDAGSPASCAICLKINGAGTPSPPRMERRSTEVLDLIHVGLHGTFHVSPRENRKYSLAFVDDFSRYCITYQVNKEKEMEERIKTYLTCLRTKFKRIPKAFHLGDGTEGLSEDSRARLENEGIALRCDAQESELSGSIKWEMSSLLEMARCMLADARLPEKFGGEAFTTATYLLNRLPAPSTGKTPFELWHGRVPSLNHIRVFGSLAHTHLLLRERQDAGSTTEQAVFIGYSPFGKLYRVLKVDTGEFLRRHVVRFVEEEKADPSEVVLDASESGEQMVGPSSAIELGSNSMQEEDDGTSGERQTPQERGRDGGVESVPVEEALQAQKAPEATIRCSPRPNHRASDPRSNCPASSPSVTRDARQSSTAEVPSEKEASLQLWHRRFAHRNPKLILEMQNHNLAVGLKVSESDAGSPASCAICLKIKRAGTPSPPKVKGSSTKVLELIHVDLHSLFHEPSGGSQSCFWWPPCVTGWLVSLLHARKRPFP